MTMYIYVVQDASPPVRGRELKSVVVDPNSGANNVAPRAGAGIEISNPADVINVVKSPPVRGRELKFCVVRYDHSYSQSPPVRGRELKLILAVQIPISCSRPPCGGGN